MSQSEENPGTSLPPPPSPHAGAPGDKKKKVYDRVLLWMLDIKPLNKDMRTSPLIEVSYTAETKFPYFMLFPKVRHLLTINVDITRLFI